MESEVFGASSSAVVVAHELKGPLSLSRQLALSLEFEDSLAGAREIGRQIATTSERALRQVEDLTRVARLDDALFEMEPVAVRAVCDDVTRELEYLFAQNHKELRVKYANRAKLVNANRELLYSVVYNFLLNAMHYADEGRAELFVGDTKGRVKILIRDFGPALPIGIWREMKRGWIEQPVSIAMRSGSSGLGLYIASKFSRYMGATVGAVRHRDGASFYVELPISKQASLF